MAPTAGDSNRVDMLEIPGKGRCYVYLARYAIKCRCKIKNFDFYNMLPGKVIDQMPLEDQKLWLLQVARFAIKWLFLDQEVWILQFERKLVLKGVIISDYVHTRIELRTKQS